MTSGETVAQLGDWHFDHNHDDDRAACLERRFELYPTDECVQYVLQVAAAPSGTQITVNGRSVGAISAPCTLDITAFVSLDENQIAFRVERSAHGAFGAVRLQAVPCE